MRTPNDLLAGILAVYAIRVKGGFRIEIGLAGGERITIKQKSTRAPTHVQLYKFHVNGNARRDNESKYFTFSKAVPAVYRRGHLGGFEVYVDPVTSI